MIFIKQLNHWIMQFMAKSRTVYLSLDLLQYARKFQETTLSTWFMIFPVYQHPSESGKEKRWETGSIIKDAMFFRKLILLRSCYWFNIDVMVWYYLWFKCIFLCFNHIQLYCFYHHEKQNKTNTQTNKQLLFVQSAPVKEYYGVFRQDQLLVVGECKQARSCQPWRLKNVGLLLTCASFNFFQKFIVLQRGYHHARRRNWINKDV